MSFDPLMEAYTFDPNFEPPEPRREVTHSPTTCQVCREPFATVTDKAVHVTLAHDLGRNGRDRTTRFSACPACSARVYEGQVCECGRAPSIPDPSSAPRSELS